MAPRTNYALAFKTKVVEYALAIGNWTQAGLEHGVDEACVRRWIKLLNRSSETTLNNPIARRRRVPTLSCCIIQPMFIAFQNT